MNLYRRVFTILFFVGYVSTSFAQPIAQRKDWFFGRNASIHFDALDQVSTDNKNPITEYSRIANAYMKNGDLVFFSDGRNIYDRNMTVMASTGFIAQQVQIVRHSENDSLFNMVILVSGKLYHAVYDPFDKTWKQQFKEFESGVGRSFTMIKHCYAKGFWILCPLTLKKWKTYYLQGSAIQSGPQSDMPLVEPAQLIDLTSNHKGDKIAASNYAADGFAVLADFDPKCGTVSNSVRLPQSSTQIGWDYPLGLDFSPADNLLYVCYSNGLSQLVQYQVNDVTQNQIISQSMNVANQFDDIVMAPDGRAYLNRHNFGIPSRQIDVIEQPNLKGLDCDFKENVYELKNATNAGFQFPPFLNAYISNYCENNVREFRDDYLGTPCMGNDMQFFTFFPDNTFTEVVWVINYAGSTNTETGKNITVDLNKTGILKVTKIKRFCNFNDTLNYEFEINSNPVYTLTRDTTICDGDVLDINLETDAKSILWSTGDTVKSIKANPGSYQVTLKNGLCSVTDSVKVSSYPPLSILLADNFYICEREKELVKLDAGKGFANYLWNPTQDTTQWIIIDRVGDYYVVVDDFRGCKGDKGTKVNKRCDIAYFIPNAISPNGDGLNDRFRVIGDGIEKAELQIYNRWGELVFKGDGVEGWNASNTQEGIYVYIINIQGYKSKRKVVYHESGTFTLIR